MIACYVRLTKGKVAIFDWEDRDLMEFKWYAEKTRQHSDTFYAKRKQGPHKSRKTIYLHTVILERMGFVGYEQGDHKNRNSLDNRRCNLRPATYGENTQNTDKTSQSGYRGVMKNPKGKKWSTQIKFRKTYYYLGSFSSPEKAAVAYNRAAINLYGKGARLNDILS